MGREAEYGMGGPTEGAPELLGLVEAWRANRIASAERADRAADRELVSDA